MQDVQTVVVRVKDKDMFGSNTMGLVGPCCTPKCVCFSTMQAQALSCRVHFTCSPSGWNGSARCARPGVPGG